MGLVKQITELTEFLGTVLEVIGDGFTGECVPVTLVNVLGTSGKDGSGNSNS